MRTTQKGVVVWVGFWGVGEGVCFVVGGGDGVVVVVVVVVAVVVVVVVVG